MLLEFDAFLNVITIVVIKRGPIKTNTNDVFGDKKPIKFPHICHRGILK